MPETLIDRAAADIPLTRSAREALERAVADANRRPEADVDPIDVMRAVLAGRGSLADQALYSLGVDPSAVIATLPEDGASVRLPLRQLLVNANREAQVLGHYQVDSIHLLLALLYSDSPATSAALQKAGLTLFDLRRHLQMGVKPNAPVDARPRDSRTPDKSLRRRPLPSLRGVLGVSWVFAGILATVALSGLLLGFGVLPQAAGILTIVFVTAGWVASVCLHEFGHAVVAYLGGDRSVAASGYLTLDPLRYTNLLLSIALPIVFLLLGGIGLPGGAVYIDRAALRSRWWDSAVSLAGPVATFLTAILVAVAFIVPARLGLITQGNVAFFGALSFLGFVEVFAVVLNLIPIPGLDGFGVIRPWLPYAVQASANRLGMGAIVLVFVLLFYVPPVAQAMFGVVDNLSNLLGLDPYLIYVGSQHMHLR